jgi:hypothetical protein
VLFKGAALIPALAFMFASTNRGRAGAVLWLLMGWQFVLAEITGSFVLIRMMAADGDVLSKRLGRKRASTRQAPRMKAVAIIRLRQAPAWRVSTRLRSPWRPPATSEHEAIGRMATAFWMDCAMLWKEVLLALIAGFLAVLMPHDWWKALFIRR